jgi:hypothetical protein
MDQLELALRRENPHAARAADWHDYTEVAFIYSSCFCG